MAFVRELFCGVNKLLVENILEMTGYFVEVRLGHGRDQSFELLLYWFKGFHGEFK